MDRPHASLIYSAKHKPDLNILFYATPKKQTSHNTSDKDLLYSRVLTFKSLQECDLHKVAHPVENNINRDFLHELCALNIMLRNEDSTSCMEGTLRDYEIQQCPEGIH